MCSQNKQVNVIQALKRALHGWFEVTSGRDSEIPHHRTFGTPSGTFVNGMKVSVCLNVEMVSGIYVSAVSGICRVLVTEVLMPWSDGFAIWVESGFLVQWWNECLTVFDNGVWVLALVQDLDVWNEVI